MGRKKKPPAALNFDISIDVHGDVNLYKQGKGPTVQVGRCLCTFRVAWRVAPHDALWRRGWATLTTGRLPP